MSFGNKVGKFIDRLKWSSHCYEDRLSTKEEFEKKYKDLFNGFFKKFSLKPLAATKEEIEKLYEPLAKDQFKEFSSYLKMEEKKVKCFFTGHHGSGLTTELNAFKYQLRDNFYSIIISIQDVVFPDDLTYEDIIFLMGMKLLEELLNFEKDENFTSAYKFYAKYIKPEPPATEEIEYKSKFKEICSRLKIEAGFREEMRKDINLNLAEMIKMINKTVEKLEKLSSKTAIILVDDIEKVNMETAVKLFNENSKKLIMPDCRIIYTMPLILYYSQKYTNFNKYYDRCLIMPLVKIYTKDNKENEKAMEVFEKIVGKRIDFKVYFEEEVLTDIIVRTGGLVKCLIEIIRKCCAEVTRNPRATIDDEILEKVVKQWKTEQYPLLNTEARSALRKVYTSKSKNIKEELFGELFNRDLILEYRNKDFWFDIHPLIREAVGVDEEPEYEDITKK